MPQRCAQLHSLNNDIHVILDFAARFQILGSAGFDLQDFNLNLPASYRPLTSCCWT